jgi:hypothetical protein
MRLKLFHFLEYFMAIITISLKQIKCNLQENFLGPLENWPPLLEEKGVTMV